MKKLMLGVAMLAALIVPTTAVAHTHHHHKHHHRHHHLRRHHARSAEVAPSYELEIVSVGPEYTQTADEAYEDQVAVEAAEGQTWGEPPTTEAEEATPASPE